MNRNSEICSFIAGDSSGWKEKLEEKNIKVKREGSLAIFSYGPGADFSDPVVQEARGIIIDLGRLEVACWPFRKFGNWQEPYADEIDWNTARVQEKVDGSIIRLWHDKKTDQWRFSTNSVMDADKAPAGNTANETFGDIIRQAGNYAALSKSVKDGKLDPGRTYMFELVSPKIPHVVKYPGTFLYHIGTRDNVTGTEYDEDIGIRKPAEYPLRTLGDCVDAAAKLNGGMGSGKVGHEGFVVVDGNWNRIKVKSPEYLIMHRASNNGTFSRKSVIEGVRDGSLSFDGLCEAFPEAEHILRFYQWRMAEIGYEVRKMCSYTDRLIEEYNGDRKAVAMAIKGDRYAFVGFRHFCGMEPEEILKSIGANQYLGLIGEYEERKFAEPELAMRIRLGNTDKEDR